MDDILSVLLSAVIGLITIVIFYKFSNIYLNTKLKPKVTEENSDLTANVSEFTVFITLQIQ